MSTLTQQWLEQGRQEGLQMGEAMFLIRLLERRFGSLSELCQKRIEATDREMLLKWGERVLSARNLEEVFSESSDNEEDYDPGPDPESSGPRQQREAIASTQYYFARSDLVAFSETNLDQHKDG